MKFFKNDLYYIIMNSIIINNSSLLNCYLYTNINNTEEYLIIKLILAITNYKKKFNNKNTNLPILIFKNNKHIISLNN